MREIIVFDLDDTLFPERAFVISGFKAVSEWLNRNHGIQEFFTVACQLFADGRRGDIFNTAMDKLVYSYGQDRIAEMVSVYRRHIPVLSLFEDAHWALEFFAGQQFKMALITDGYLETQKNKVLALKLEERFDAIIFSDMFGRGGWKPSPLPYQEVTRRLGVSGRSCVYIADNPAKDFVTAKALGWGTIHIMRKEGEYHNTIIPASHQAEIQISSLFELKGLRFPS